MKTARDQVEANENQNTTAPASGPGKGRLERLTAAQLRDQHLRLCGDVYGQLDLEIAPQRFRYQPGARSRLHKSIRPEQKSALNDKNRADLFRQLNMSGDPYADAAALAIQKIGMKKGLDMLDDAIKNGIESVRGAPDALVALMEQVDQVPDWVDWQKIDRFGELARLLVASMSYYGLKAGFVWTFMNAYQGLPMILTGALSNPDSAGGRVVETTGAIRYLALPDSMRRDGEGFRSCVRVRVMHAIVRVNLLTRNPNWDPRVFGVPLPQTDMYAASMVMLHILASMSGRTSGRVSVWLDELRELGLNTFAYYAYVIGVHPETIPRTLAELDDHWLMMQYTLSHRIDPWARELTDGVMNSYLYPGATVSERLEDKIDRYLCELLVEAIYGKRDAAEFGVRVGPTHYLVAPLAIASTAARIARLGALSALPGGRRIAQERAINQIRKDLGLAGKAKFETDPSRYQS